MKYYIGEVHERNGEFEYDTKYLFATSKNPDKYAEKIAMTWRGGDASDKDDYHDAYWSYGTLIFNHGSTEIPKQDFEILRKYLTFL